MKLLTEEQRRRYIEELHAGGISIEEQIRRVLPLVAGELTGNYAKEEHIRASRYVHDVRWLLGEIDRLRCELILIKRGRSMKGRPVKGRTA